VLELPVIRNFTNMGHDGARRRFPGFPQNAQSVRRTLSPRDAIKLEVGSGDMISLTAQMGSQIARLVAFDGRGEDALDHLGLKASTTVLMSSFDSQELRGWCSANGREAGKELSATVVSTEDMTLFRAEKACVIWVICPALTDQLVNGSDMGQVDVSHMPAQPKSGSILPPPLGDVREEFTVASGTAVAYEVAPGEIVQIIDVEGQQCSDFTALRTDNLARGIEREIDTTATRSMVRGAYPGPGLFDKFFDRDLSPMMQMVQDTCGRHDTFGMACTSRGYEERGFPGHVNCSDNISNALNPFGVGRRPAWPAINFFWNTWIDQQSHHLLTEESHSRPGDYVALRALDRLVCVSTACPDDIDPINGWNPTDVHVRIYRPDVPIQRAVAYREKENAPMSLSQHSAFEPETSKLTQHFAPARDVWAPVSFPSTGTVGEYWACREGVTLQDMSSLRKYDVVGPDAERLLQRALTRDVSRLAVWRGTYALICDKAGAVVDDGTLFRLAPDLFRWCCGTEESARVLNTIAQEEGLQARINGMGNALPNLALQGPLSREVLRKLVFTQPHVPALDDIKWFGATVARVGNREGIPFMLARSGYTGELGYELFCSSADAPGLWAAVMDAGQEFGITPMGSAALEILRVEAGLAAANAEFAPGVDALEAGLGFAVSFKKSDFVGRAALERNAAAPRKVLKGLWFEGDDVPAHGAHVFCGERPVGKVTSAVRSPKYERAIAMARLSVEFSETGHALEVGQLDGHMKRLPATVSDIPFYDPKRERARA
jgi:aminomethyltransferase